MSNGCEYLRCEHPCQDDPYGSFYCSAGHWDSCACFDTQETNKDPWKFCRDYKPK